MRELYKLLFAIALVAVCLLALKCESDKEVDRLKDNQTNLTATKGCDTINHITEATVLTAKTLQEVNQLTTSQEKAAIKKVGTKVKRVNSITSMATTTRIDTFTRIDTIYKIDTVVPVFHYRDQFCDFAGELENGNIYFDIKMQDSINIIAHRVPRKMLFGLIKFGTKAVRVDVYNSNPYCTVRSAKQITLVK